MKRQILGVLLTCLLLPACSKEADMPVPLSGEAKIQSLIDPEIQGADREVVAAHFRAIAEEYWDDMVLLQDGKVYSNRVSLLGTMVPVEVVGPGMGRIAGGDLFALPERESNITAQTTGCTGSSGPFRRVRTAPGTATPGGLTAFSYSAATIAPPLLLDDTNISVAPPPSPKKYPYISQIPYVYLGGTAPSQIDAGLQYNPGTQNWGAYALSGGAQYGNKIEARYSVYDTIRLEFFIIGDGSSRLLINGTSISANIPNPYHIDIPAPGYKLSGIGNAFKRVTTIAQRKFLSSTSSADVTQLNTGAYFPVGWQQYVVGRRPSALTFWNLPSTVAEDCSNPGPSSGRVTVSPIGSNSEEVSIDLR